MQKRGEIKIVFAVDDVKTPLRRQLRQGMKVCDENGVHENALMDNY